ncbi:MAG: intradiol ring-cleavage dioxygenase [Gemmatimonadaceae bacterium]
MDHDDDPVGRILSRREVLTLIGAVGTGMLPAKAAQAAWLRPSVAPALAGAWSGTLPACVVRPEQTEGPYFVDEKLNRADIRSDPTNGAVKAGVPLDLEIRVSRVTASSCAPLAGALVDLWQCDGEGAYSDVRDAGGLFDTRGQKFLRGYRTTDSSGSAKFTTIYPGWYPGRTVHIHFKVRTPASAGRSHEFTSQLYFDDALTDEVFKRAPYAGKPGQRVRNERDGIVRRGGPQLMLALTESGGGYAGSFDLGMQLEA